MMNEGISPVSSMTDAQDNEVNLLGRRIQQTAEIAHEVGLRPFPTQFFIVPARQMYELAAYGLPGGFSHWSRGGEYHKQKTMYDYGLTRIYEMVVNSNPALAFLLENNSPIHNTTVAAHVAAHVDFFAHNPSFAHTNRHMNETALLAAERMDRYRFEVGEDKVEQLLDAVLTIQMNFDFYDLYRPSAEQFLLMNRHTFEEAQKAATRRVSDYDDLWKLGEKRLEVVEASVPLPFREEPDLLWFITNFSPKPLEDWQRDCLEIIREEGQYFLPQRQTKIMNEGWATLWHQRIMRIMGDRGYITEGEAIEWVKMHAGVVAPFGDRRNLNPYQIGCAVWEDIDRRSKQIPRVDGKKISTWFGQSIDEPFLDEDPFTVRAIVASDEAFLRNYLTAGLIEELELFTFVKENGQWVIEERDPEKVKERLFEGSVNLGLPVITVASGGGDYQGNRELYLLHHRENHDLDFDYTGRVLPAVYQMWGRPVHLETVSGGRRILLSCIDGKEVKVSILGSEEENPGSHLKSP